MNIIFMGTPAFAVPSLEILLNSNHKISAVITVPDKPKGRGLQISESEVKKIASAKGLNILQPEKLKDPEFIKQITNLNPDLIIVVAFRILPKEIYTIPKFGSFNLHASLLPKYRGAAPINRSIINGDSRTGVTSFFLKEKVDTGGIILQSKCDITADDDAGTLHDKLSVLGAETVLKTVKLIESTGGNPPVIMQDESQTSFFRRGSYFPL
jgi:methionyl-tRNA formyltransferase